MIIITTSKVPPTISSPNTGAKELHAWPTGAAPAAQWMQWDKEWLLNMVSWVCNLAGRGCDSALDGLPHFAVGASSLAVLFWAIYDMIRRTFSRFIQSSAQGLSPGPFGLVGLPLRDFLPSAMPAMRSLLSVRPISLRRGRS